MSLSSPPFDTSSTIEHHDCNDIWNEQVFYDLGLDQVWCDNGNWIPDEYRYHIDENCTLDWYSYCRVHQINWPWPQRLPGWAIDAMDRHFRDLYHQNLTENN
jgi:hypothetical protein